MFNLIDNETSWKIDLIVAKDRPFSRSELARRQPARIFEVDLFVATAEDTILAKLEWASSGESDRQLRDVGEILRASAELDCAYLDRWAAELGVAELLAELRKKNE